MFARSFAAIVLVLPALAAASALPQNEILVTNKARQTATNQCNTGTMQCCNSTQSVQESIIANLLGSLGVVTGGADTLVGTTCSPITAIGTAANSCSAQPVCCTGNNFNGIVVLGCNALDLSSLGSAPSAAELADAATLLEDLEGLL